VGPHFCAQGAVRNPTWTRNWDLDGELRLGHRLGPGN